MQHWAYDAIFYHIYPLGLCNAPRHNNFQSPPTPRLNSLYDWIPHMESLSVNALYLGPLFESSMHGYDTADYYHVDRRLGDNETLKHLSRKLHSQEIRVVLDGVFHHVGRDFWAFRDVQQRREQSPYRDWFAGLHFDGHSPYGDPFVYDGWRGNYDLVKLNLHNPAVKEHLFQAVAMWIREFEIDGLRLDVADCLSFSFMRELAAFCRELRPDFWLMGEVIHGDYSQWANQETLDSVTNYECYKGLYSSLVDKNYFEIAYALDRQFGEQGIYKNLPLYAFADNHDVNRVASNLTQPEHLYPLYCLLFTMPGVPSIYYGSEWGVEGKKVAGNDLPLRPRLDPQDAARSSPQRDLAETIAKLARIRRHSPALKYGNYHPLFVGHEQLAFARQSSDSYAVVALNAAAEAGELTLDIPLPDGSRLVDQLNPQDSFTVNAGKVHIDKLWPHWARILVAA